MKKLKMVKKRPLPLPLALVTLMLLPTGMMAQNGLFGPLNSDEDQRSMLGRHIAGDGMEWSGGMILQDPSQPRPVGEGTNIFGDGFGWSGNGMITQDPTQEAPLESGLLVLAMAGVGYAIMESKKVKSKE